MAIRHLLLSVFAMACCISTSGQNKDKEQYVEHFADPCLDKGMALLAPFPENNQLFFALKG